MGLFPFSFLAQEPDKALSLWLLRVVIVIGIFSLRVFLSFLMLELDLIWLFSYSTLLWYTSPDSVSDPHLGICAYSQVFVAALEAKWPTWNRGTMASRPQSRTLANEKDSEKTRNSAQLLNEDEKAIIEDQLHIPEVKVGYFSLYRYANKKEIAIMLVSSIAAIAAGAVLPLMTVSNLVPTPISSFPKYWFYISLCLVTSLGASPTSTRRRQRKRLSNIRSTSLHCISFISVRFVLSSLC